MSRKIKGISYGVADFEDITVGRKYFVDKTRFIPMLEEHKYVFFIRPRIFGKSLWLSVAEDARFLEKHRDRKILRLLLVYHGWEMVCAREV